MILYETEHLKLFKEKQVISLLNTTAGFFLDDNNNLLGNIVTGYKYKENGKTIIEPKFKVVTQVFLDNTTVKWVFTDGGYVCE